MTAATASLRCPVGLCHRENAYGAEVCAGCGTPLSGYARLHVHPAHLFNRGLAAAREGRLAAARDCFAAVVHWCPGDTESRNALALAALTLGDHDEARRQWTDVLTRRPGDPKATRGLARLAKPSEPDEIAEPGATAGPDQTVEPGGTAEPGEPGGTNELDGTGGLGGTGEPVEVSGLGVGPG